MQVFVDRENNNTSEHILYVLDIDTARTKAFVLKKYDRLLFYH